MSARDRSLFRPLLLSFFVLTLLGALPALAAPFTPPIWRETVVREDGTEIKGKLTTWNRDRNRNFIDDVIDERMAAGETHFDVILAFNRCVTCCEEGEDEIVKLLREVGTLDYIGRYLTFASVLNVAASDVVMLSEREEVAMVEALVSDHATLDVSVAAVRVRASTFFSSVESAAPGITGAGGNIAVLDTGVDNAGGPGTTHAMFPAGTFVGGANCLTDPCTITDPDDDNGHGTHVAGIALGRSTTCVGTTTCRGVAPGAGLVDIKILDSGGNSVGLSAPRGVELAIAQRAAWNIRVLNLSVGNCLSSNGVNVAAQLLNTAVMHGLVVVISVGNTPNCTLPNNTNMINAWASSSLAITVGAVNDGNTVPLGNDTLAPYSFIGPRPSDGDGDPRDEQKPEIVAPGTAIRSASFNTASGFVNQNGTSMAAPHVAGAAALLLQASPGMNPGSVKEVLIQTAAQSNKPGPHPGWNTGWGFGFLNMHGAVTRTPATDVGYPTPPPYSCGGAWCSPHISTASAPRVNQGNTITAAVRNHGGAAANGVRVCFGIYVFSNNNNRFHEIDCRQVNIPAATTQNVSIPWTPSASLIPNGFPIGQALHACLKVSIDYALDTVTTNNDLQRNTSVATASVARAPFRLENNTTEPLNLTLRVTNNNTKWNVRILEKGKEIKDLRFTLAPDDCPRDLIVELEPQPGVAVGDRAEVTVQAVTERGEDYGGIVINGLHVDHAVPGLLAGQVRDDSGAPLPGVTVRADGSMRFSTVTDADGRYRITAPEGTYTVIFELAGFTVQTRSSVTVDPGLPTALDAVLGTGGSTGGTEGRSAARTDPRATRAMESPALTRAKSGMRR